MSENRPVLRFKNGTAADLKQLKPTWNRPDGNRQCPKCQRNLPLTAFGYDRLQAKAGHNGFIGKMWQPTHLCQRCRQGRKRVRER